MQKITIPVVAHFGLSPKNHNECAFSIILTETHITCVIQGEFYSANTYILFDDGDNENEDINQEPNEDTLKYHYCKKIILKKYLSSLEFYYDNDEDIWCIKIGGLDNNIMIPFKDIELAKNVLKKIEEWMIP